MWEPAQRKLSYDPLAVIPTNKLTGDAPPAAVGEGEAPSTGPVTALSGLVPLGQERVYEIAAQSLAALAPPKQPGGPKIKLRRRPHAASNGTIYTGVALYNDIAAAIAKMAADAAKEAAKGAKGASAKLAGEQAAAQALSDLNGHGDLSKLKAVQVTALLKYKFGHERVPTRKADLMVALAFHATELGVRVPL